MSIGSFLCWNRRAETAAAPLADHGPQFPARDGAAGDSEDLVASLLRDGCYARVLSRNENLAADDVVAAHAWKLLEAGMALVPGGPVYRKSAEGPGAGPVRSAAELESVLVQPLFLDRYAVTNAEFARFVAAGGYDDMDLWPVEIWPNVLQFVDRTGQPGPRFWRDGQPPRQQDRHPVVGVCWYEAQAYARWAGKRLPTSLEWERAGSWITGGDGRESTVRYPWGNAFDPARANTFHAGKGGPVPVDEFRGGCTPNGICQLIGNVWEWVADRYHGPTVHAAYQIVLEQPMAEIRGGAFDTYFEAQANGRFRTGQPYLYRGHNVGFRCAVSPGALREPPQPEAFAAR